MEDCWKRRSFGTVDSHRSGREGWNEELAVNASVPRLSSPACRVRLPWLSSLAPQYALGPPSDAGLSSGAYPYGGRHLS
jgi:hypothetical protein